MAGSFVLIGVKLGTLGIETKIFVWGHLGFGSLLRASLRP